MPELICGCPAGGDKLPSCCDRTHRSEAQKESDDNLWMGMLVIVVFFTWPVLVPCLLLSKFAEWLGSLARKVYDSRK